MSKEAFEKWWENTVLPFPFSMSVLKERDSVIWECAQTALQPEIDRLNAELSTSQATNAEINQVINGYVSYEKECIKLRDALEVSNEQFHSIKNVLHDTQAELSASRAMCDKLVLNAVISEREACAKVCDDRAKNCEEKLELTDDKNDRIELHANAWQFSVLASAIRKRGS